MQKYTKESKELRDKIIAFAKSLGFKVNSSEKQARAYRIWMKGPKSANEKIREFLAQNKVAHADEEGYDETGHDEFVSDIETSFQNNPFKGNMLVITHWYATPTKLDRGIDATVSDKDYFGEIRREIRKVLCEQEDNSDKWALGEFDKKINAENPPSIEDVQLDNVHGIDWHLVKVEDYGPETVGSKVFTKYALYRSAPGLQGSGPFGTRRPPYECEYVYDSRSGKWELGAN